MPLRAPARKIRCSRVKEVEYLNVSWLDSVIAIFPKSNSSHFSTTLQTGNIWVYDSNGSWWVCTDAVIWYLTQINTHFITSFPNYEGDFPNTMSLYTNERACLVNMNESITQTRSFYRKLFRPYRYNQQFDMLHPSAVGVCQLICHRFLIGMFPKRIRKYWCRW